MASNYTSSSARRADIIAAAVALGVLTLAAGTSIFILVWPIPDRNETLVGQMLGALWSALTMVVGWFFGSTRPTHKKRNNTEQEGP